MSRKPRARIKHTRVRWSPELPFRNARIFQLEAHAKRFAQRMADEGFIVGISHTSSDPWGKEMVVAQRSVFDA
jgi:hypothetical protein